MTYTVLRTLASLVFIALSEANAIKPTAKFDEPSSIECYVGLEMNFIGMKMAATPCPRVDQVCSIANVNATVHGMVQTLKYGQCVEKSECSSITREDIKTHLQGTISMEISMQACDLICCESSLCTEPTVFEEVFYFPSLHYEHEEIDIILDKTHSDVVKNNNDTQRVECNTGIKAKLFGKSFERTICKDSSQKCSVFTIQAYSHGKEILASIGQCMAPDLCESRTCNEVEIHDMMFKHDPFAVVEKCTAVCNHGYVPTPPAPAKMIMSITSGQDQPMKSSFLLIFNVFLCALRLLL